MSHEADQANIGINPESARFISSLLANERVRRAGINSRRKLTIIIFKIIIERLANQDRRLLEPAEGNPSPDRLPRSLFEELQRYDESKLFDALYVPNPSSAFQTALRNLLSHSNPEYAELNKVLDISVDDICDFAAQHGETE